MESMTARSSGEMETHGFKLEKNGGLGWRMYFRLILYRKNKYVKNEARKKDVNWEFKNLEKLDLFS